MIIDCHVHLSTLGHEGQTFPQIRDSLLSSMSRFEIDYAFVYADSEPDTGVSDLGMTLQSVANQPQLRMLGTTCIPPTDPDIITRLAGLAETGEIIGIKLYPGFELFYPDDESCYPFYELCALYNMPVVYHSGETMDEPWREKYNHPYEIAKVADRFATLKIVIAHFSEPHLDACRDTLQSHPNIHADISGLAYPGVVARCGKGAIAHILEDIVTQQPGKVLFGTDWPICDVGAHLDLVASLPITDAAKELILGRNAERVFAFELDR
jgi:predicted TIM-barrel fold metal-dependent hydrolase